MTWHLHRWSNWEDYPQLMGYLPPGRPVIHYTQLWQRRRCVRCGERQERQV